jgi:hypothetical protein
MRTEFRALADHYGIEVGDAQVLFVQELSGVFKEKQAGRAFPFWIGVRKMRADVAKACGTEQRVAQGVYEYITIGMSDGPLIERDFDSADHELAAFSEAMQIVANS